MARKIAITNEKGGCGKTTTAVNLAAILAERGQRVLLIDADCQSYTTMYYGLYQPEAAPLREALLLEAPAGAAISATEFGVDVLRSSAALKQAEDELAARKLRGQPYSGLLSEALAELEGQYDVILVDCPPQSYRLLETVQAYVDDLLLPMIPDEFALHSLRIKAESLVEIRRTLNPRLRILGGLIVMDERNATKAAYKEALMGQSVVPFFRTTIRKNITLSRAINARQPINKYDRRSNGNRDYQALADELMEVLAR